MTTPAEQQTAQVRLFRVAAGTATAYGVEFPSGRVVIDHPTIGLCYAAVSLNELRLPEGWHIEETES